MKALEPLIRGGRRSRGTLRQSTIPRSGTDLEQVHSGLNTQGGYCSMSVTAPTSDNHISSINTDTRQ